MKTRISITFGLLLVLTAIFWAVWSNEQILRDGKVVLLELAPVDPRSLMQGDYMALRYALADEAQKLNLSDVNDGYLIVRINADRVASFVDTANSLNDRVLKPDEVAIYYRMRRGSLKLATNAFFFQEGKADIFAKAKYGEFRVGANGEPRLVGLRNEKLERLGEE